MATFVLISGAWHASWCWERVVPLLEARGHRAIAPDLLGMGPEPTALGEVTLARWGDQVADIVRAQSEPVILVGHSRGGTVISEAAERAPDSIRTLVYLAAFLLPSGMTLAEAAARVPRVTKGNILAPGPDGSSIVQPEAIGPTFYNMTPSEWVARAIERLTPEPAKGMTTAVNITQGAFGRVPRAYIECSQDNAVPLELQRAMQAELPCDPVFTLETDHSPFYSAPELLVATLEKLAACN